MAALTRLTVAASSAALAVGGLIAAAPAGASSPATPSTASPSTASGCPTGDLPGSVMGNPNVKPGQLTGVYLGHGTGPSGERVGYGLAVTHPGSKPAVFTGTVKASAPITAVKVRDEKHDVVRLSADHRTLTYRFVNFGKIDGVAFRADCAQHVTFTMSVDGHKLPASRVYLGAGRAHPSAVPFTLTRS